MSLIDDFKARFPEIAAGVVDEYFPLIQDTYDCYYGGSLDVKCEKEAILNLLAHLLLVESSRKNLSQKSVASRSAGGVSVSYQPASDGRAGGEFFRSTRYGQRFLMLTQHGIGGVFV